MGSLYLYWLRLFHCTTQRAFVWAGCRSSACLPTAPIHQAGAACPRYHAQTSGNADGHQTGLALRVNSWADNSGL